MKSISKKARIARLNDAIEYVKCRCDSEDGDDSERASSSWRNVLLLLEEMLVMVVNGKTVGCPNCHPSLGLRLEYATDKVPWSRKGHPHFNPRNEKAWSKKIPNTGISKERLIDDDTLLKHPHGGRLGLEERAFAMLWDYRNNGDCSSTTVLDLLLSEEPIRGLIRDEIDRYLVMATAQSIIQWLGTNCGASFIDEARQIAGEDEKRLKKEQEFIMKLAED